MVGGEIGPRRRLPAAERRQLILQEARSAFLEAGEGIGGVSVRAIAQRCGVDEALVYRHFGTKDDLYTEAVLGPIDTVVRQLASGAEIAALSDVDTERVQRMWDLTYDVVMALCSLPPDVVRAVGMLQYRKSKEAPAFYEKTLGPALRDFENVVESELPHWKHRPFSTPLSVRVVISTCFWVVVESDVSGQLMDRERTARDLTDLMLYGMVQRDGSTDS